MKVDLTLSELYDIHAALIDGIVKCSERARKYPPESRIYSGWRLTVKAQAKLAQKIGRAVVDYQVMPVGVDIS